LLQHIPPEYPIYGLQAHGMSAPAKLPENLHEMAAQYVEHIRRIQPSGPYYLLGWSLGGLIAHAVACRLQQEGAEVGLLALLEAYPLTQTKFLEFPQMQEILSGLMQELGRDAGDDPLDVAGVMESCGATVMRCRIFRSITYGPCTRLRRTIICWLPTSSPRDLTATCCSSAPLSTAQEMSLRRKHGSPTSARRSGSGRFPAAISS
jgi:pimeloyl-ACP methyl ester carboxylesterase